MDITIVLAVFSLTFQGRNVQVKTYRVLTPANVVITLEERTVAETTSMFSFKKPTGAKNDEDSDEYVMMMVRK